MNRLGLNETKLVYVCPECGKFEFHTRVVDKEPVPKTRRIYCMRCGIYVLADLQKDKKK